MKDNQTLRLINNRKSLRVYQDKALSAEEINTIINGAQRAPTAGNMMLYSILEVSDPINKEKLAQLCDHQSFIAKAPLLLIFLADAQRWNDYFAYSQVPQFCEKNNLNYEHPQEADFLLACCDALIAAQNAVITAESIGIGSCYIGDIMENIEILRQLFHLPSLVFPITMLCFGHYHKKYLSQKPRSRFAQKFIHFKDHYERISSHGFQEMFQHLEHGNTDRYLKNAKNFGQHTYLRKTDAPFKKEMNRSVKVALQNWLHELEE